ncbi:Gfo/Idh/MocA family oxidoreductase [Pseudonocardia sp. MH-G8]|uniref:Gfo/Idh/MocA family oxidoreductase n=1 Tax=Pseudonocardia sp. MH-G8 TaxID=1854588 RepID=UPI000BA13E53|nr:Gfo/Idh/MocA family oxidoreductase [Pseudonocardia sp. MH-G8]OZM77946.1 oxidoreductase [Pseudonocardia sp. MH-G8]
MSTTRSRDGRVRIAVAGLGRIGALHAENLAGRVPHAQLVRVIDVDEDRARAMGERLGVAWSTDTATLWTDDVDAVVVASPTPTHPEMVRACAAAGKAVFCEKPLGLTERETLEALADVDRHGVALQVGMHRRFDPDTLRAKELAEQGELGEVYSFRTSLRDMLPQPMDYIRQSGSFFVDVTIHDLDLARFLVGEIVEVSVFGASVSDPGYAELGTVDHAAIVVRFANGSLGLIDNSRVAGYGYEASTEIVGSTAAVRIGGSQRTNVAVLSGAASRLDHVTDFVERFTEAYRAELEAFVESVRGSQPVGVTGWDALAAFTLARACDRAFTTGRPVRLEHEVVDGRVRYLPAEDATEPQHA